MSRTVFDFVSPAPAFDRLPIRIEQVAAHGVASSRLLLLTPAVIAIGMLLTGVAVAATAEPTMLDVLTSRPLASLQIGIGLLIWAALFVIPASRALAAFGRRRVVEIADGSVVIEDRAVTGSRIRRSSLTSYQGVAHHIRASLSGLRHEIVLVHVDPALTVTLAAADKITQTQLDNVKALLRLPEVPARAIYERSATSRFAANDGPLAPAQA